MLIVDVFVVVDDVFVLVSSLLESLLFFSLLLPLHFEDVKNDFYEVDELIFHGFVVLVVVAVVVVVVVNNLLEFVIVEVGVVVEE